ncbi:MAG TPA: hypothetical protein VHT50_18335, partial [Mycobacterium sp.]|nr:hypothetical protein [Mycobacterium sp.]
MLGHRAHIKAFVALMWTSVTLFAGAAFAQSPAPRSNIQQKEVAPAHAEEPQPGDLKSELDTLKAENLVVRELLRKMEEQQRVLMEQVDRLQRRIGGGTAAVVQPSGQSQIADGGEPSGGHPDAPTPAAKAGNVSAPQASLEKHESEDRYQDGIIIWRNAEDAKVPFLLKFNNNTQIRYLNTLDSSDTFTDHLGSVREVHRRNDITVNRSMFTFTGYMFDPRLQ